MPTAPENVYSLRNAGVDRRAARTTRLRTHITALPPASIARSSSNSLPMIGLLILDDFGPEVLTTEQRRDLLEIVEDRYNARSLLITSQIPIKQWYDIIGNSTLADAILDRIVHNAYRIELSGETLRDRIDDTVDATSPTPGGAAGP